MLAAVARALVNKGSMLGALNRPQEAIAACDEVVGRFGQSDTPAMLESVARALVNKGAALGALNRPQDAIAAYDEVVRRFGQSDTPAMLESVARALMNKGAALGALNRPQDAIVAYDEVIRRFGKSDFPTPHVGVFVEEALLGKAIAVILLGGDRSAVEPDIEEALSLLPKATLLSRKSIRALMELSVALGPQRMCELIQESPSVDLLSSLTTALERELGREPRVSQEVNEVAQDIHRQLEELKAERRTHGPPRA